MNVDYHVIAKSGEWQKNTRVKHKPQKRFVKIVDDVKFDTEIDIYSNKVSIYSFRPPYAGVIIEDQAIHQTIKSVWKLLWDRLK